jgi:cell division protein FtsN
MSHQRNRYKHSRRGWALPALKVTLVVVLMIGAFAIGFLKLGPAWRDARRSASVRDSGSAQDASADKAGLGDKADTSDEASAAQTDETNPREITADTALASIYIAERPGPEGNVIARRVIPSPPEAAGGGGQDQVQPPQPDNTQKPTGTQPKPPDSTRVEPVSPTPSQGQGSALYRVQVVGLFMERASAEALLADVRSKGFEATLVPKITSTRTFYRVQAGAFESRENAESVRDELAKCGFSSTIVEDSKE